MFCWQVLTPRDSPLELTRKQLAACVYIPYVVDSLNIQVVLGSFPIPIYSLLEVVRGEKIIRSVL